MSLDTYRCIFTTFSGELLGPRIGMYILLMVTAKFPSRNVLFQFIITPIVCENVLSYILVTTRIFLVFQTVSFIY